MKTLGTRGSLPRILVLGRQRQGSPGTSSLTRGDKSDLSSGASERPCLDGRHPVPTSGLCAHRQTTHMPAHHIHTRIHKVSCHLLLPIGEANSGICQALYTPMFNHSRVGSISLCTTSLIDLGLQAYITLLHSSPLACSANAYPLSHLSSLVYQLLIFFLHMLGVGLCASCILVKHSATKLYLIV